MEHYFKFSIHFFTSFILMVKSFETIFTSYEKFFFISLLHSVKKMIKKTMLIFTKFRNNGSYLRSTETTLYTNLSEIVEGNWKWCWNGWNDEWEGEWRKIYRNRELIIIYLSWESEWDLGVILGEVWQLVLWCGVLCTTISLGLCYYYGTRGQTAS